jgi:EmrB/QacA subfamily drug resistance transporter
MALLVIAAATLLVVLDSTIVTVALPTIRTSLDFTPAGLEWVITAYSVAFGGLLLLGGRAGDLYGRRRMFMIGIAIFSGSSLLGGLAMNQVWLVAARAVQGAGAAIAAPAALSLIATTFPEGAARNRAMGVYATVAGSGGALGLALGGILTQVASWRWVFFVAVPIGVLVLYAAPRVLTESNTRSGRLDLPGAVTATGGVALLVYGLIQATQGSWGSPGTVVPLAAAAVLLATFVIVESRTPHPLLPLHILANRNRSAAYVITLAIGVGLYGVTFFLMLFVQNILGFTAIAAGVGFLPLAVAIGVLAATMGRLATRVGTRAGVICGPLIAAAGAAWLSFATPTNGSYLGIVGPMILLGAGLGAAVVPLTLTAIAAVPPTEAGIASALVSAGQQIGGSTGLAVLGTVAAAATRHKSAQLTSGGSRLTPALSNVAITSGYHSAFLAAAGILAAAFVVAMIAGAVQLNTGP